MYEIEQPKPARQPHSGRLTRDGEPVTVTVADGTEAMIIVIRRDGIEDAFLTTAPSTRFYASLTVTVEEACTGDLADMTDEQVQAVLDTVRDNLRAEIAGLASS